jgi:hypothetical protein
MYQRQAQLVGLGLRTFLLDQEFIEAICDDVDCKNEQQQHEIFLAKRLVSRETYEAARTYSDIRERKARTEVSGNPWDIWPTRYLQRFQQRQWQAQTELEELQHRFDLEAQARREQEVKVFRGPDYLRYEEDRLDARIDLVKQIMDRSCGELGFAISSKLSTTALLVFTKPLVNNWAAFLAVPRKALEQEIGPAGRREGSPFPLRAPGPDFAPSFGAIDIKTRRALSADSSQALLLKFEWFLPIHKSAIRSDYNRFYTLEQLDALVNIHMTFYRVLQSEFEDATTAALA